MRRFCFTLFFALFFAAAMFAAMFAATPAANAQMPGAVAKLFAKHRINPARAGIVVRDLQSGKDIVRQQANKIFNPASAIKVATALLAVDMLGPEHQWQTAFATDGKLQDGAVDGNLYIVGGGDPYITIDRFLYMLHDLRNRGVQTIRGDLVIDDSIFALPPHDPNAFDGAPLKPYNTGGGGLAVNFAATRVMVLPQGGAARVFIDPPNDNISLVNKVRIKRGGCRNWRGRLRERYELADGKMKITIGGNYAKRCGAQAFYIGAMSHPSYAAGVFAALWKRMGGELRGEWRRGVAPESAATLAVFESPPLAEILRAMNKHSNNVIARNLFLSLAEETPRTLSGARVAARQWLARRGADGIAPENGSGLSRRARASAAEMARLLEVLWRHPHRSDVVASLPALGVDGTLRRRLDDDAAAGAGRLKTGSLKNVKTLAGFMRNKRGRNFLVVFFYAGKSAARANALQNDLLKWIYNSG